MIGNENQDAFLREHRWCVVTTLRKDGSPTASVNAYAVDGDNLLISTTADRFKAKSLENDPRIVVTALSDSAYFSYVAVEGTAIVEREGQEDDTRKLLERLGSQLPANLAQWIAENKRVIIRVTPTRVSGSIRAAR